MSTHTAKKMEIQTRNHLILSDLQQLKKREPKQTLQSIFKIISKKYDLSMANTQYLYYSKFKMLLEANEDQTKEEKPPLTEETVEKARWKDTLLMDTIKVRVYTYIGDTYIVAKDILKACGIKSQSNYLNTLTNDDNRLYVPILSSQGMSRTRLVQLDTCLRFLATVSEEHTFVSIKMKAKEHYEQLKAYRASIQREQPTTQTATTMSASETNKKIPTQTAPGKVTYQMGDEISFTVTYIGSKAVSGITNDKASTPASIYISDVTDKYIRNLRDYFTTGETLSAIVKFYDKDRRKLSLTTRPSQIETITNQLNETNKPIATPVPDVKPVSTSATDILTINSEAELEAILHLINHEARIGALTPQAKAKLVALLNTQGIVKVIMGIKETMGTFQPDLGLAFLDDVEKTMRKDCL